MKFIRYLNLLCFSWMIPWAQGELQVVNFSIFQQKIKSILMKQCISEKLNPVVISNDLRDRNEMVGIEETMPTISIDLNFEIDIKSAMFSPELPTYILSTNKLQTILQKIKSSSWWNINSRFLIIDISEKCDNAWKILQIMWKMNLLSSLFMCQDDDDSVTLYTYNPYANYAPYPWRHMITTFNEKGHQWTLFNRFQLPSQYGCNGLFFDKTKHLNGSEVIAGAIAIPNASVKFKKPYNVSSIRNKNPLTTSKPFEAIFSTLNVTSVIYYIDLDNPQNITNQTIDGLFLSLADSTYDIALNYFIVRGYSDSVDLLYPRHTSTYVILTRHNKVVTSLDGLGFVFSKETLFLTALIFVMTLIVLLFCKRPKFGLVLLEILRLILSTSTLLKFYRDSLRIFIVSVLIFVIFMTNIYQGQMSAHSIKMKREAVDSIADLQNLKYKIYMLNYTGQILGVNSWSDEQKKCIHFTNNKCIDYVIDSTDYRTACIFPARHILSKAMKYDLHVSLITDSQFTTPLIRSDWPLKIQFDLIMSRLSEAGFSGLWESIEIGNPLKKMKLREIEQFDGYREVVILDFYYIFLMLGVSLATSIVVFVIEIFIQRLRAN